LLEAMGEGQVSVEGKRRALSPLFFVVATQNPVEFRGTYPLPEAQMDRFMLQLSLGYLSAEEEVQMLSAQQESHPLTRLARCVSITEVLEWKQAVTRVRISTELKRYAVDLVGATRSAPGVRLGASPRASLALMKCGQALARFDGLDYVTPDHLQELAVAVVAHRLLLDPQAQFSGQTGPAIVRELIEKLPVPA
jgi:MoxR-like ATPase